MGRIEQRVAAAHAVVDALVFTLIVGATKGRLGAVLAGDMILLGRQFLHPFLVGFFNFVRHFNDLRSSSIYLLPETRFS